MTNGDKLIWTKKKIVASSIIKHPESYKIITKKCTFIRYAEMSGERAAYVQFEKKKNLSRVQVSELSV